MAAAEILSIGTGSANSSDLVVTTTPVTIGLKTAAAPYPGGGTVSIQLKDDTGSYRDTGITLGGSTRTWVLTGPGTYRFTRLDNGQPCGVFSA